MRRLFDYAQCYYHALIRKGHPELSPETLYKVARSLKKQADDLAPSKGVTQAFPQFRRSFGNSSDAPTPVASYSAKRCFLYCLATHYYKHWIECLGTDCAESQLLEAAIACKTGYTCARSAKFQQLSIQQLSSFLAIQQARKKLLIFLADAKSSLLNICIETHTKLHSKTPADFYTDLSLHKTKAQYATTQEERYSELTKASDAAIELINLCKSNDNGLQFHIKQKSVSKNASWVYRYTTLILLETAKHAPTVEEAVSLIEKGLIALKIPLELSEDLDDIEYFEFAKALLRKNLQQTKKVPSLSRSSGIFNEVVPKGKITRPRSLSFDKYNLSNSVSPFSSPYSSPMTTPRDIDDADELLDNASSETVKHAYRQTNHRVPVLTKPLLLRKSQGPSEKKRSPQISPRSPRTVSVSPTLRRKKQGRSRSYTTDGTREKEYKDYLSLHEKKEKE